MTLKKGIYRVLACPCGFSALQQEENPKVFTCDHCGKSRTLDGSPVPLHMVPIAEVAVSEPRLSRRTEWWKENSDD